jgi:drug/metabolite transporter (DMT)-like permease
LHNRTPEFARFLTEDMKPATIVGILLIIVGVVALAYGGFNFTTHEQKRVVDLGPLKVDANVEKEHSVALPPILGISALAGGIVLVVVGSKK